MFCGCGDCIGDCCFFKIYSCDKNKKHINTIAAIITAEIFQFNFINLPQSLSLTSGVSIFNNGFLTKVFRKEPTTTPTDERILNNVIGVIFVVLAKYFFIIALEDKFVTIPKQKPLMIIKMNFASTLINIAERIANNNHNEVAKTNNVDFLYFLIKTKPVNKLAVVRPT